MTFIQALCFPVVLVGMVLVLRAIDVKRLLTNNKAQHSIFASLLGLSVLWSFHTQLHPGLDINFLGLAAVTLMLGFRLAIVVSTIAFVASHFFMGVFDGVNCRKAFAINLPSHRCDLWRLHVVIS